MGRMPLNSFQNAYVTRNLDKAVEGLRKTHGLEDFIFFDPDMDMITAWGTGPVKTRVAIAWDGNTQIEVIQPVSGHINHYLPYLPDDDSLRFHHTAVRIDDMQEFRAEIARSQWPVVVEKDMDGLEFVYLDARASIGHYVEYMWATPEWWKILKFPGA